MEVLATVGWFVGSSVFTSQRVIIITWKKNHYYHPHLMYVYWSTQRFESLI